MKAVPEPIVERVQVASITPPESVRELDDGLAAARFARGWSFIALHAPVVAAPALVAAFQSGSLVAWSSQQLTLVGIGAALELRASGVERWREMIERARSIVNATPGSDPLVRPRLLGGAAFAPGAADAPPWGGPAAAPPWGGPAAASPWGGPAAASPWGDPAAASPGGGPAAASPWGDPAAAWAGASDASPWAGFGDAWFVLPRWTYVHDGTRGALVLAIDAREAHQATRWQAELATIRTALATPFVPRPQPPLLAFDPGDRAAWRREVRQITDAIARGQCAKIVAARNALVTLGGEARAADMLAELDARHAETVRFVVRPPGGATLVAATPERLVRRDGATVACDALAGSARPDGGTVPCDGLARPARPGGTEGAAEALRRSAKDRREHDLVVDAIASALRDLGASVVMPAEPGVRALRHVLHLHTPIEATLREPRHLLELAAALHPTPAVGGTPTGVATSWITAREAAPRGWYASPVGWFDLDGNGELAVAIRSGLLAGNRAYLWAGAGIVGGSDADRELAETDLKLRAMLGALGVAAPGAPA